MLTGSGKWPETALKYRPKNWLQNSKLSTLRPRLHDARGAGSPERGASVLLRFGGLAGWQNVEFGRRPRLTGDGRHVHVSRFPGMPRHRGVRTGGESPEHRQNDKPTVRKLVVPYDRIPTVHRPIRPAKAFEQSIRRRRPNQNQPVSLNSLPFFAKIAMRLFTI